MYVSDLKPAFHFTVRFSDSDETPFAFQEVSGLESGMNTEDVTEGGENRFVHKLPKPAKNGNLVLTRGIMGSGSAFARWCKDTTENDLSKPIIPKDLVVSLIDQDGQAVMEWTVTNAYPVAWSVAAFDAMKNEFAIENIELAYAGLSRNN